MRFAEFIDSHDISVAQLCDVACLALEALEQSWFVGEVRRQDFQRHLSPEVQIHGLVDSPHAARGEVHKYFVFAETAVATAIVG